MKYFEYIEAFVLAIKKPKHTITGVVIDKNNIVFKFEEYWCCNEAT